MTGRRTITPDKLNDVMEFDHVIRVWPDGTISKPRDVFAPDVSNLGEDVSEPWDLMTGYTGQYGYKGPCMHASEFIGGRMAEDILSEPGWYVALVAEADQCREPGCEDCSPFLIATSNGEWTCPHGCDLCASDEPAGWVVAYVEGACEGHEPEPGNGPIGGDTVYCDGSCRRFPRP